MLYAMAMERTTIFLPGDLRRRLADESRRRRKPQAELMREALEGYLNEPLGGRRLPSFVGSASVGEVDARDAKRWLRGEWERKWAQREDERRRDPGT